MTPLPALDPLPLPAPVWLLSSLLVLTFTLHVVPMNLLLGGSIIGLVARIRGRHDGRSAALARVIANALPVLFAATITLGVAALLFLQVLYGRAFFSAAVLLAVPWILIVPVLVIGYYGAYVARGADRVADGAGLRTSSIGRAWFGSIVVAIAVLSVAFIQANVMSAVLHPDRLVAWFVASASGLRLNLGDSTFAPRLLHVLAGACAVAGVGLAIAGYFKRNDDEALSAWMVGHGAMWFIGATMLNLLFGVWWLAALPVETVLLFLGRDLWATLWISVGVVAALAALGHMIPAVMARDPRTLLYGGAGSLVVALACMVMVRDTARRAALAAAGLQRATWVEPQWGAIALFGVLLVTAIATVGWMARAYHRASGHLAN
jgi:hypothetical protein